MSQLCIKPLQWTLYVCCHSRGLLLLLFFSQTNEKHLRKKNPDVCYHYLCMKGFISKVDKGARKATAMASTQSANACFLPLTPSPPRASSNHTISDRLTIDLHVHTIKPPFRLRRKGRLCKASLLAADHLLIAG